MVKMRASTSLSTSAQNLKVGDRMIAYNTTTGQYVVSTVTSIVIEKAANMLVINTVTAPR